MRIATLMAACVLVGCGGASSTVNPLTPSRIIAFGDAFSTVDTSGYATYSVNTSETNATVASRIASIYGFTMKNYTASSSSVLASGTAYSYAVYNATSSTTAAQIGTYLNNGNTPGSSDLFIITAGTRDIISQASSGYNSTNTAAIADAATALTTAIQRLTNAGAQYVLVMQPINVARTPGAVTNSYTSAAQAYSYDTGTACVSFSCLLSTKLNAAYPATSSHQPILLADLMSYFNLITGTTSTGSANTYTSYGVTNPDTAVCNTFPLCTTSTVNTGTKSYTGTSVSWDYTASVFAYDYYTTPFANRLLADYIYNYNFYRAGWR